MRLYVSYLLSVMLFFPLIAKVSKRKHAKPSYAYSLLSQKKVSQNKSSLAKTKPRSLKKKRPQKRVIKNTRPVKKALAKTVSSARLSRPNPLNKMLLLQHTIQKAVNDAHKRAAVGVKIALLHNNVCIFKKNSDQLFTPASNTKSFTAAAAFHTLGPDYQFVTKLFTDRHPSPKIHNLFIKGGGDPTLTVHDLESLVHGLKARRIREVKGDLIVDATFFDTQGAAPGWRKGDGPIFDKAPTGALMVNHSCICIRVKPSRVDEPPLVFIEPDNAYIRIENKARTKPFAKKHGLHVMRMANNTIVITGTIGKADKQKFYRIALEQPSLYAGQTLATILRKHKITFKGKVILGAVPPGARQLTQHMSAPLSEIVRYMMKKSDNLYADAIYKAMGAVEYL